MKTTEHLFPWLELIGRPAFCVKDDIVIACNSAAQNRMLRVGADINEIVTEHRDVYQNFTEGCLFLTVTVGSQPYNASVNRTEDCDIFILDQDSDADHLQAFALAAQQLRIPLTNVMAVSERLISSLENTDTQSQQQAAQLQRGLFQLLRIVSNMSDSGSYKAPLLPSMEMTNLTSVFQETIEKAQTIFESTGIKLAYTKPDTAVLGFANGEHLERAAYNILSNALKFSPAGSTVEVKLSHTDNRLSFTVCNSCAEPVQEYHFWNRYRREPTIEDSRHGLGLGMTLIRAAATMHGGTVLIDHPDKQSTRVTITVAIVKANNDSIRSPIMRISDYAGGRDKALLEFSDLLPSDAYHNI